MGKNLIIKGANFSQNAIEGGEEEFIDLVIPTAQSGFPKLSDLCWRVLDGWTYISFQNNGYSAIRVTPRAGATGQYTTIMYFFKEVPVPVDGVSFAPKLCDGRGHVTINAEVATFEVPSNCQYIVFAATTGADNYTPSKVTAVISN